MKKREASSGCGDSCRQQASSALEPPLEAAPKRWRAADVTVLLQLAQGPGGRSGLRPWDCPPRAGCSALDVQRWRNPCPRFAIRPSVRGGQPALASDCSRPPGFRCHWRQGRPGRRGRDRQTGAVADANRGDGLSGALQPQRLRSSQRCNERGGARLPLIRCRSPLEKSSDLRRWCISDRRRIKADQDPGLA